MNREQKKRFAILVAWIAGVAGLYLGSVAFARATGARGVEQWAGGLGLTIFTIFFTWVLFVLGKAAYVWIRDGYLG